MKRLMGLSITVGILADLLDNDPERIIGVSSLFGPGKVPDTKKLAIPLRSVH
jgi:hypothetical protein